MFSLPVRHARTLVQEPHICHTFDEPFYGKELKVLVSAYLRPEANFPSLGARATQRCSCPAWFTASGAVDPILLPCLLLRCSADALIAAIHADVEFGVEKLDDPATGLPALQQHDVFKR